MLGSCGSPPTRVGFSVYTPNHTVIALVLSVLSVGCTPPDTEDASSGIVLPEPEAPVRDPALEARIDALIADMDLDAKVRQLTGRELIPGGTWDTWDDPARDIPPLRTTDGPRGVTAGEGTVFPVAMARAASWDPDLERRIGAAIGAEARALDANVLLAPVLNLTPHPAYGRAQETYGEDPYLVGAMGAAFIEGAQQHVLANAKHFAGNHVEDTRFDVDVRFDERVLHEVYLPAFREGVVQAGVATAMAAYNQVDGTYCAENDVLLTDVLRDRWGFDGLVVSDWVWAAQTAEGSIRAGLDVEMPIGDVYLALPDLVASGAVDLAEVDAAVRRVLRVKLRDVAALPEGDPAVVRSEAHRALAREAAVAGMVLLRNEGVLPLQPGATVAVVGRLGATPNLGDVGSSDVPIDPDAVVTPLRGLQAGALQVVDLTDDDVLSGQERTAVSDADVAVVVVGLTHEEEGENIPGRPGGDRETLRLSPAHEALIAAAAAVHDRVVVVVQGGSTVDPGPWIEQVEGLLVTWYAGEQGGHALSDVLTGAVEPSGRLPTVVAPMAALTPFPDEALSYEAPVRHGWTHLAWDGVAPTFPFGFGLGFGATTWSSPEVEVDGDGLGAEVTVRVTLDNPSDRVRTEVVQAYAKSAQEVPRERLVAFERVVLQPGERREVVLRPSLRAFAAWDPEGDRWILPGGAWTIRAGANQRDAVDAGRVTLVE